MTFVWFNCCTLAGGFTKKNSLVEDIKILLSRAFLEFWLSFFGLSSKTKKKSFRKY